MVVVPLYSPLLEDWLRKSSGQCKGVGLDALNRFSFWHTPVSFSRSLHCAQNQVACQVGRRAEVQYLRYLIVAMDGDRTAMAGSLHTQEFRI